MAIDVEDLFRRYGPMVHRRCLRLLRHEEDARDAAQDVFVRLVQRKGDLTEEHIGALLWTMATQVSLNRLRTRRRKPEHGAELLDVLASTDDPEDRTVVARLLDTLFAREPDLFPSTRALAVMRWVDGMTLDEISAASGMSVAGVRKRLSALRRRVQELKDRPVDEGEAPPTLEVA